MVAEEVGTDDERSAAEFLYDANGPIPLAELVNSFAALDANFARNAGGSERLAVSELRSGSVIAVLVPFIPLLSQPLEVMNAANTVADFVKRIRSAINGFADLISH